MRDPHDLFDDALKGFENNAKWHSARFGKIKQISNTLVGDVGQTFIEALCDELKLDWDFPQDAHGKRLKQSPWDIKIGNVTYELKTATEDVSGAFQFNHIRYHRRYDALICLGVTPSTLYFNAWTKADVTTNKAGTLVSMEKGANASYKLTKKPADLKRIDEFQAVLENIARALGK